MKTIKGLFMSAMLLGMLGIPAGGAEPALREAAVTAIQGQVEILKSGAQDWQAAAQNQKLQSGDKVKTGAGSTATVTLDEGSTLVLSEGTEFTVKLLGKDDLSGNLKTALNLLKGKLKADVTPLTNGASFEIDTPVVVAAVLGTTFNVGINSDGSVTIASDSGAVSVTQQGPNHFKATVASGEAISVFQNPQTGEVRVTNKSQTPLTILAPDGTPILVSPGQTVIFSPNGPIRVEGYTPPETPDTDVLDTSVQNEETSGDISPVS